MISYGIVLYDYKTFPDNSCKINKNNKLTITNHENCKCKKKTKEIQRKHNKRKIYVF